MEYEMVSQEKQAQKTIEKYHVFFNYAKGYYWLNEQKRIGNIERVIIKEYHVLFHKILQEATPAQFEVIWIKLSEVRADVLTSKKENIKEESVLDFLDRSLKY